MSDGVVPAALAVAGLAVGGLLAFFILPPILKSKLPKQYRAPAAITSRILILIYLAAYMFEHWRGWLDSERWPFAALMLFGTLSLLIETATFLKKRGGGAGAQP